MRILVTGDCEQTSYEDRMWLYAGLNLLHSKKPITEIIEGGGNRFDHHSHNWALWRRACGDIITLTTVPARWEEHGRDAEPIRNAEMAQMRPDVVLACPGGEGTANMVEVAKKAGLTVIFLEKMPVLRAQRKGAEDAPGPTP